MASISNTPPVLGEIVYATGANGRQRGERHRVTRIMPHTTWTVGLTPGSAYCDCEDFVDSAIFWETFTREEPCRS